MEHKGGVEALNRYLKDIRGNKRLMAGERLCGLKTLGRLYQ
jgi:hypothetical protein